MTAPPLLTAALPGFRAWIVDSDGGLCPAAGRTGPWQVGVNTARCAFGGDHEAPASYCTCGLYAFHTLHRQLSGEEAIGAIAAWGAMDVYRDGFRARHASVIALAGSCCNLEKAAERYGVPIVPRRSLQALASLRTGLLPPSLVDVEPHAMPAWLARRRGYAEGDQVWVEPAGGVVTLGISAAARAWLGDGVAVEPAEPRTDRFVAVQLKGAGGALVLPALVRGTVVDVNEAPGMTDLDPEGAAWLVRIAPSDWEADCRGFTWGPAGHAAMLADTARNGARAFEHLSPARAGDAEGISSWRDVAEMLRALQAQTPPPAFASTADLYDEIAIPLGQALARDRSPTRLDSVIAIVTRDPAARLVLDLRREQGRITTGSGPTAELEATLSGDDLLALLEGRLDLARESRTGRLRIRGSLPHALTSLSIVAAWARPHVNCVRQTTAG